MREPQASTNLLGIRARHNSLFFNNLAYNYSHDCRQLYDQFSRFARDSHFPLSNELHAIAEHRPALMPGAD